MNFEKNIILNFIKFFSFNQIKIIILALTIIKNIFNILEHQFSFYILKLNLIENFIFLFIDSF
jgi:hypothetical protein